MKDNKKSCGSGCKGCPGAPRTYEEYCLGREYELGHIQYVGICPDAYSEKSQGCGDYGRYCK